MQWLIDLVIEAIGVPPCYIDRGDPAAFDFEQGVLTADAAWHDLDLSAIVPAGATAVSLRTLIRDNIVNGEIALRSAGRVNSITISTMLTRLANISNEQTITISLPASRIIEYRLTAGVWDRIILAVQGWWL